MNSLEGETTKSSDMEKGMDEDPGEPRGNWSIKHRIECVWNLDDLDLFLSFFEANGGQNKRNVFEGGCTGLLRERCEDFWIVVTCVIERHPHRHP